MILIGSRAQKLRAPHTISRAPLDFDFCCTKEEFDSWMDKNSYKVKPTKVYELPEFNKWICEGTTNLEFEIIKPGTSAELLQGLVNEEWIETPFGLIPPLDLLFAIKDAHKYKKFDFSSNGFWKTACDWHMMKAAGATIRPEYEAFHKLRKAETYTYLHPKLNVNKDEFFKDDGITYTYEHDDIHKSVALHEQPAYTFYLKDGEQVQCDKNKFFSIDAKYRLAGVVEEAAVLAIERSLVPNPGVWTPEYAWKFALSKVCSSITSGWFRAFAYENILEVLKLYPTGYWEKFQKDVDSGMVKLFTGSKY